MEITDDLGAARAGDAGALARLGLAAHVAGRVVEAVYWMTMAYLRGARDIEPTVFKCVDAWRLLGCPEQIEKTHEAFSEEQRQFGFCVLLWHSGIDRPFARNWFSRASRAGNYDAGDFMMEYGSRV